MVSANIWKYLGSDLNSAQLPNFIQCKMEVCKNASWCMERDTIREREREWERVCFVIRGGMKIRKQMNVNECKIEEEMIYIQFELALFGCDCKNGNKSWHMLRRESVCMWGEEEGLILWDLMKHSVYQSICIIRVSINFWGVLDRQQFHCILRDSLEEMANVMQCYTHPRPKKSIHERIQVKCSASKEHFCRW